MNLLLTVLLLLICLLISNIVSHYIPFIPTALIQIALGVIIAFTFKNISFEINSEWFLLLFVAPLLYNDGRHFLREKLWKMKASIFGNAIVLVLLTTIGGGYFIHWLIPYIPLAAAFALAAILSPTDPVAVNGIAQRIHIPESVLTLVSGESLINDASGLVAFNYAVTAVVTGYFSLKHAVFDFLHMFIIGAILGLIINFIIRWIGYTLRKKGIRDITFHSLLQILTPFIIYIATEEIFHASGVIAVVVAGIEQSFVAERTETMLSEEKILIENTWSNILFILNGVVFLLLGLNIPISMIETVRNPNIGNWLAIGYAIAIGIIIIAIRFIWSYFFSFYKYHFREKKGKERPGLKMSLFSSLTGVRGAVTMAGVLSIPYITTSGRAFPERSLILFLAAGVILFTLIVATVFLPLLSRNKTPEGKPLPEVDLNKTKKEILLAAINRIKHEINEENESAAYELMNEYKLMLKKIYPEEGLKKSRIYEEKITKIRLRGLKEERRYIHELMEKNKIAQEEFEIFEKIFDVREEVLSKNVSTGAKYILGKALRGWKRLIGQYGKNEEPDREKLRLARDIQIGAFKAAVESLEKLKNEHEGSGIVKIVILDYRRAINMLNSKASQYNEKKEKQKEELRVKIMDIERYEINRMYESGEITWERAREMRQVINYIESATRYNMLNKRYNLHKDECHIIYKK